MACIRKEIPIDASPEDVWAAVRDWGALHERLVPGFALDTRLDGEDRIVTFATGEAMGQGTNAVKRTLEARAVQSNVPAGS